jgi:phosphatidylserine/phosphatidylglycerophosphate/cardiolipin synthase-like enzyme
MDGETGGGSADVSAWFVPPADANPKLGNTVTYGNEIVFYIEYRDYYKALADELAKTSSSNHFIYFADWQLGLDTWMDAAGKRATFRTLLENANRQNVQIRSLLYNGSIVHDPVHNQAAAEWINSLQPGAALLDNRYLIAGSHHQKMVIIKNSDGVVGFCGGMDIAENRQRRDDGPNPPISGEPRAWHDVQARIAGPAALFLWRTFNARWIDFQQCWDLLGKPSVVTPPFPDKLTGKKAVQVVRTFGNGARHEGLRISPSASQGYPFAPAGEMTIYKLICSAIRNTKETIYLEDQYLVESEKIGTNDSIAEALADTISKSSFKLMVILVPGAGSLQGELCQVWRRRTKFWQLLGPKAIDKVKIYAYRDLPESPYLVHSKTWIFDDSFAIVSSANSNRRGYSHDSEVGVGVADLTQGQTPLPKDLRVRLWLKHLNTKGPTRSAADVDDFAASAALWDTPDIAVEPLDLAHPSNQPPDHLIVRTPNKIDLNLEMLPMSLFLSNAPSLTVNLNNWDREWNYIIDPDGS